MNTAFYRDKQIQLVDLEVEIPLLLFVNNNSHSIV